MRGLLARVARDFTAAHQALDTRFIIWLAAIAIVLSTAHAVPQPGSAPAGMVWIPGGEFTMGTDERESYPPERPAHRVKVDGFWMDKTEVTNEEFERFVKATGYVTTAEKKTDWEDLKKQVPPGTPKPSDEMLAPGSMVFVRPDNPVDLRNIGNWWQWMPGANWRHPEGPKSSIKGKEKYPVVQVSWDDAVAYAKWDGKRLPTEAEWEFAARGGLDRKRYAWGDELKPSNKWLANIFQGHFPDKDTGADGFAGLAPVASFPPNGYGLYDMIGNAWEWCSDWYRVDTYSTLARQGGVAVNPTGPSSSFDPEFPLQPERVTRGGSFLCSDHYCLNYRPSARRGTESDSGTSNVSFRCVKTPDKK
jgi:sulfatase modifying factor 1